MPNRRSVPRARAGRWSRAEPVALAVVLALGYAALHLPSVVRRVALRLALGRLERTGIVAHADSLDYNLATLSFHLSNLTLATPSSPSAPFFFAAKARFASGWRRGPSSAGLP